MLRALRAGRVRFLVIVRGWEVGAVTEDVRPPRFGMFACYFTPKPFTQSLMGGEAFAITV